MSKQFTCDSCGRTLINESTFTTGYGETPDGKKHCYECCAMGDVEYMTDNGKWTGYFVEGKNVKDGRVTNWPGSLSFPIFAGSPSRSNTNWGLWRSDFWFAGPDGHIWHGYQIGENSQIAHCKRTKRKWRRIVVCGRAYIKEAK